MRHTFPFKCSINKAARTLGVTRGHLSDVLHHHTSASLSLAIAIEALSKGKIKATSLAGPQKSRQSDPAA